MSDEERDYIRYRSTQNNSVDIDDCDRKLRQCLLDKFKDDNQNHLKKLIMHMCNSIGTPLIIKLDEINPDDFRLQNLMVYANSINPYTFLNIDLEITNNDLNKITAAIQASINESNECHDIEIELRTLITEANNSWNKNDNDVEDLTTLSDNVQSNITSFIECRKKEEEEENLMLLKDIKPAKKIDSRSVLKQRLSPSTIIKAVKKMLPQSSASKYSPDTSMSKSLDDFDEDTITNITEENNSGSNTTSPSSQSGSHRRNPRMDNSSDTTSPSSQSGSHARSSMDTIMDHNENYSVIDI